MDLIPVSPTIERLFSVRSFAARIYGEDEHQARCKRLWIHDLNEQEMTEKSKWRRSSCNHRRRSKYHADLSNPPELLNRRRAITLVSP